MEIKKLLAVVLLVLSGSVFAQSAGGYQRESFGINLPIVGDLGLYKESGARSYYAPTTVVAPTTYAAPAVVAPTVVTPTVVAPAPVVVQPQVVVPTYPTYYVQPCYYGGYGWRTPYYWYGRRW